MNPIEHYVVEVDRSNEGTVEVGGNKLFLDTRFNEYHHITQKGVVVSLPARKTSRVEDVKIGDTVYFHHFVVSPENDISKEFDSNQTHYILTRSNLYARTRGEHTCAVQGFVFVEPIQEKEEDIKTEAGIYVKPVTHNVWRKGIVRYAHKPTLKGLKVFFKHNHDYEMDIAGDKLYRMTESSLLAHESKAGAFIPMEDSVLVRNLEPDEKTVQVGGVDLLIPSVGETDDGRKTKFKKGEVVRAGENTSVSVGDKILFRKGLERRDEVEEGGEKFFILKEENIEAIFEE